jgi:uncharacterized membrane protein
LWQLRFSPVIIGDEDTYAYLAAHFWQGRFEMFAVPYPFVTHPPVFFALGGIMMGLFGQSILSLRLVAAVAGILSSLALYYAGHKIGGKCLGCFVGLSYALLPDAIFWNKTALGYSLLGLWIALALALVAASDGQAPRSWWNQKSRWFWFALLCALMPLTEIGGVVWLCVGAFVIYRQSREHLLRFLLVSCGIPALVFGFFYLREPRWFVADLFVNSGRNQSLYLLVVLAYFAGLYLVKPIRKAMHGVLRFGYQVLAWIWPLMIVGMWIWTPVYAHFAVGQSCGWLGMMGLFFLPRGRCRQYALVAGWAYLLFIACFNRSDRFLIPLFPFWALGMGLLADAFYKNLTFWLETKLKSRQRLWTLTAGLIGLVFLNLAIQDVYFPVQTQSLFLSYENDRQTAIHFLNSRLRSTDTVVLAAAVGLDLVDANKATLSQFEYYREANPPYICVGEKYLPERYYFDTSPNQVDYLVVDRILWDIVTGKLEAADVYQDSFSRMAVEIDFAVQKLKPMLSWQQLDFGEYIVLVSPRANETTT